MFEFLIYEDDIDNKKASLSDIKNKIDELEKKTKR
jgi:archaellum component FlaC